MQIYKKSYVIRPDNMDKVSVRLTTVMPHFFDDDDRNIIATINQYYKNAIKDIQNLVLIVPSEFQNVKPYTLKFKYRKYNKPSFLGRKNGTLSISFNIDLKNTSILCDTFIGKTKKTKLISDLPTVKQLIIIEYEQIIQDIIFALNISYGALFHFSEGKCIFGKSAFYINNKKYKDTNFGYFPDDVYYNTLKRGWPKLQNIPFLTTWNWLYNKTNFIRGDALLRIDRALNALSYIYNTHAYDDIFYLLIGIEALYNKGKGKVINQIEEKISRVLGCCLNSKNIIRNMYDVRSNFVHGRFPIHKKNCDNDAFMKDNEKYYKSVDTALSILICSFQILINKGCISIEEILSLFPNNPE